METGRQVDGARRAFFPVGLLAALAKGRWRGGVLHVALAALILSAGMEVLQLVIQSRVSSATDAIVGALRSLAAGTRGGFTVKGWRCHL